MCSPFSCIIASNFLLPNIMMLATVISIPPYPSDLRWSTSCGWGGGTGEAPGRDGAGARSARAAHLGELRVGIPASALLQHAPHGGKCDLLHLGRGGGVNGAEMVLRFVVFNFNQCTFASTYVSSVRVRAHQRKIHIVKDGIFGVLQAGGPRC